MESHNYDYASCPCGSAGTGITRRRCNQRLGRPNLVVERRKWGYLLPAPSFYQRKLQNNCGKSWWNFRNVDQAQRLKQKHYTLLESLRKLRCWDRALLFGAELYNGDRFTCGTQPFITYRWGCECPNATNLRMGAICWGFLISIADIH
jgi:hypothetical protein